VLVSMAPGALMRRNAAGLWLDSTHPDARLGVHERMSYLNSTYHTVPFTVLDKPPRNLLAVNQSSQAVAYPSLSSGTIMAPESLHRLITATTLARMLEGAGYVHPGIDCIVAYANFSSTRPLRMLSWSTEAQHNEASLRASAPRVSPYPSAMQFHRWVMWSAGTATHAWWKASSQGRVKRVALSREVRSRLITVQYTESQPSGW
jgi:hypothetical protein